MVSNEVERLLNRIGELLADDQDYDLDRTLLYARLAKNVVAPSIFKDLGDHVLYRDPDLDRLGGALLALWEAEPPDKRWAEFEYLIRDGSFEANFIYSDEIDPDEDPLSRRRRIVARYFGDKPIVYPPMPEDDDSFFEF